MVIFQYNLYSFGIHLWTVLYPKPCYNEQCYKEVLVYIYEREIGERDQKKKKREELCNDKSISEVVPYCQIEHNVSGLEQVCLMKGFGSSLRLPYLPKDQSKLKS